MSPGNNQKLISSIWKGKHTKFEYIDVSEISHSLSLLPERDWLELFRSWKNDPELDMGICVPNDHPDFQTYKELSDFSIQHFNNENQGGDIYEVVGVNNVSMDASVPGTLYITLTIFAKDTKCPGASFFDSELQVCCYTGKMKRVSCSPVNPLRPSHPPRPPPLAARPVPAPQRHYPPSWERRKCDADRNKTPTPEELLRRHIAEKYFSTLDQITESSNNNLMRDYRGPGRGHGIPEVHPKYSAFKELADPAIDDYNKRHDEAKFEFVGLMQWSAGASNPKSLVLHIVFTAKDGKSDLKGPSCVRTFHCDVVIPFSTGTKEIHSVSLI